ncbi:MAG: SAM-dependent chlorinase/fluorinase [Woeseia sp.]|nr:SAM-dependent chlorinase/fluorinase [Woeseia sp.]
MAPDVDQDDSVMSKFQASGVITITTDFGHKGPFVGVMKGVIAKRFRDALIIDLTHEVPAHWPPEAGFWMSRAWPYFPSGSIHLGIVDPGVGTERDILLASLSDQLFLAPDNGLLAPLLPEADRVWRLNLDRLAPLGITSPSATFHGRDIFAPLAAELAAGRVMPDEIGESVDDWVPGWLEDPQVTGDKVSGVIVTVDAFGNLISNIEEAMIADMPDAHVLFAGKHLNMQSTYGRAAPGNFLALINSFGVLEIACAEGNAAESLGTDRGAPVVVRRATRR